jgi:hypothetical protein
MIESVAGEECVAAGIVVGADIVEVWIAAKLVAAAVNTCIRVARDGLGRQGQYREIRSISGRRPVTQRLRRHVAGDLLANACAGAFVATEQEQPVLDYGAAHRSAKLVLAEGILGRREEVSRVSLVVSKVLEQSEVQAVRPRFGDDVDRPSRGPACFRREHTLRELDFLN